MSDFGVYHVFNKSIAKYVIFKDDDEYMRMTYAMKFYQMVNPPEKLSRYLREQSYESFFEHYALLMQQSEKLVDIVAYCLMPTHVHFVLKNLREDGISIFTKNALNSYTRHFNTRHKRKGPLWVGRSKRVLVKSDEQLRHLTRYLHLNPVTSRMVDLPEFWKHSSYREYLGYVEPPLCSYEGLLDIDPSSYQEFVNGQIQYQRTLAVIQSLTKSTS